MDPSCVNVSVGGDPAPKTSSISWEIFVATGAGLVVLFLVIFLVVCLVKRRKSDALRQRKYLSN